MKTFSRIFVVLLLVLISGCQVGETYPSVTSFDVNQYLGKWYEIARLDMRFERGLSHVNATYSLRPDGGINVVNRGFDVKTQQWKEAQGLAYFTKSPTIGHLKVSFFRPFYSEYNIVALDQNYNYAMVISGHEYLWILSRTPELSFITKQLLMAKATSMGYDTSQLIFPAQ